MTDDPSRHVKTPDHRRRRGDEPSPKQDPALIWDEYKYRHDLCWRLVFQITTAVVILSVIPYIQTDVAVILQGWIISLPAIGVGLASLGLARLRREIEHLDRIATKHQQLHEYNYSLTYPTESKFLRHVTWYMVGLIVLGAMNIVVIAVVWLPGLP